MEIKSFQRKAQLLMVERNDLETSFSEGYLYPPLFKNLKSKYTVKTRI